MNKEPKIIGVKEALRLAKEIPGAKYLFLDQNGDWNTTETYLKDFSNPKKVDVGELTRLPKNGKNLGSAGDVGGLDVIWVWDISTGKKMWDFTTTNVLKESRTFSEHLKFLVEGKLNEATNDQAFSQEVYDFLSNEPMYVLNKNHIEAELELDEFPKIGKLLVKVYSEGKDKITFCLELITKDKELVTLAKSPVIDTTKQDYKKYSKKFVKYAAKMVSDLSMLHDNLNIL